MTFETMTVDVGGYRLQLSAQRAAFDPQLKSLFIADAHFGKDAVFRAHGVPVPAGATTDDLARLDALIAAHRPESIVFLGDLLHGRESLGSATMQALGEWRARHAAVRMVMVEGNHDRSAGMLPPSLGVETVLEPWRHGPWALCHYPQVVDGAYVLAGHEHPVYVIASRADSVRVPCFRFAARCGVLPAFGAFTGGFVVNPSADDAAIYAVAQNRVIAVRERR
ncbi:ligase-associated DNA damage response endonuclease PdeM [Paraburkholderia terrae]|uniref:ligase-associated DNA damage response endonuclease PdeM n=1 Tax=Paraburkholderia terrae TaxID=311230 RepID=UPI001EE16E8C|nr:ligase-associated DNA damage response endonuclease PdeM [Paraburkholderia terrae]GJG99596.1 ligase-associated DNA damage response endonuclease PdeM [Paraburkholderia terrae]GJH32688.1 ligase-associated DNA damage response endonuclease PdeM [Paraburkholderia hospita]